MANQYKENFKNNVVMQHKKWIGKLFGEFYVSTNKPRPDTDTLVRTVKYLSGWK